MAQSKNPFKRIRLVYRRSSPLLKCVVLAAIVLSTVALIALRGSILEARAQFDALRAQAAGLEQDNNRLSSYIAELGSVQSVRRIAGEELGLVDPDSIIFTPTQEKP